ncbi:MAG TPA: ABC-type transport auxiliary lipoprotein family protein [Rhizomicrobium sp.]|jgi:cholesterol transport system auxiliary component
MKTQTLSLSRRTILLASAALTLTACGSLIGPSGPPPQIYLLAPTLGPVEAPTVSWQLTVGVPTCNSSLDRQRIAIYRGAVMDYYADAQWTDEAPNLIQSLLVEAFEKSGHISAVARDSDGLHSDYLLQLELRDFEARYDVPDGAPTVVVSLVARMLKAPGREVMGTLNVSHRAAASENKIPAAVEAFNQATAATLEEIVAWALRVPGAANEDHIGADTAVAPVRRRPKH